jgi:hypothetical protein
MVRTVSVLTHLRVRFLAASGTAHVSPMWNVEPGQQVPLSLTSEDFHQRLTAALNQNFVDIVSLFCYYLSTMTGVVNKFVPRSLTRDHNHASKP